MCRSLGSAVVFAVLSAAATYGQDSRFPYHRVEVTLAGSSCGQVPEEIVVVIPEGDGKELTLTKVSGKNLWAGDPGMWLPNTVGSVRWSAEGAGGKHTDCMKGSGLLRTSVLQFAFSRCYAAQQVTFEMDPTRVFSRYVRDLVPCKEALTFRGAETAYAVGFAVEDLRLQLVPPARKDDGAGLWINDIVRSAKTKQHFLTRDSAGHQ